MQPEYPAVVTGIEVLNSARNGDAPASNRRRAMIFGRQIVSNWLKNMRAMSERYQEPGLSALLVAQLVMIFVAEPLAFEGLAPPLMATGIIVAGLILLLVLGSRLHGALIIVVVAGGVRLLTAGADLVWGAPLTEVAEEISAVLALLAIMWTISGIVFGPGHITAHRVRGAIVLYLSIAIVFAWLYRLITEVVPTAFSGLTFAAGEHGALSPFLYYSLTSLTTLGFGDITPVNAFARSLTVFEALLGQLFPAVILARILTLYADEGKSIARTPAPIIANSQRTELDS
jgi:Ion channel